jgi:AraC-like DNA-binding protein
LAFQLGYAEHSTFSRAFKGWMGISPQEFVERCGS